MARIAYVYVNNWGDKADAQALCDNINEQTLFRAYLGGKGGDVPFVELKIYELTKFFDVMESNENFRWIHFSVCFD